MLLVSENDWSAVLDDMMVSVSAHTVPSLAAAGPGVVADNVLFDTGF